MRVADYMSTEVATLGPDNTLLETLHFLRERKVRHVPIVDGNKLVGIVTDRDVKRATPSLLDANTTRASYIKVLEDTRLRRVMSENPLCLTADAELRDAVTIMADQQITGLPVVDGDVLVGIVTHTDLLRAFGELLDARK